MDTIKFDKKSTLVVAHRGLSGIETENTCAAFVAAGNRSYYGIETDIHRTADGKFAAVHDGDLERVSGTKLDVEASTLSEIQAVVLKDKDGTNDRTDLRVGTLQNYIDICKKYGKHSVLELKSDFTDEEISAIIDIIAEKEYLENVTFISFVYENLVRIRKLLPKQAVQFLFEEFTDEIMARVEADGMDIDVYYKALTRERVEELHGKGIRVNCWTVDSPEAAENLVSFGVDYITSNILE